MAAYPDVIQGTFHKRLEGGSPLRSVVRAVFVASVCLLAACTPPSLGELLKATGEPSGSSAETLETASMTKRLPSTSGDPVLAFLAEAEAGEVRVFEDAEAGTRLRVRAGRIYHAASGRICRRFSAAGEADEEGLVCRDVTGGWVRVGILVPVSP